MFNPVEEEESLLDFLRFEFPKTKFRFGIDNDLVTVLEWKSIKIIKIRLLWVKDRLNGKYTWQFCGQKMNFEDIKYLVNMNLRAF
jgi:hypothetical protein